LISQKPNKAITEIAKLYTQNEIAILQIHLDETKKKKQVFVHAAVPPSLKSVNAVEWVKSVTGACEGSGGGKANLAQGFGENVLSIESMIEKADSFISQKINS